MDITCWEIASHLALFKFVDGKKDFVRFCDVFSFPPALRIYWCFKFNCIDSLLHI